MGEAELPRPEAARPGTVAYLRTSATEGGGKLPLSMYLEQYLGEKLQPIVPILYSSPRPAANLSQLAELLHRNKDNPKPDLLYA
jgi:hypothetical protein